VIPLSVVVLLIATVAFFLGRQAYWDAKVREMCAKDGGVRIFDTLKVTNQDVGLLAKVNGRFDVLTKDAAPSNAPAYGELKSTSVRDGNPSVDRIEATITRRTDGAVVARWVSYVRFGGDIPTYAHRSTFRCPELEKITVDLQPLFVFVGTPK
jgi:hypothetical protein